MSTVPGGEGGGVGGGEGGGVPGGGVGGGGEISPAKAVRMKKVPAVAKVMAPT